jgi:hypothetical protein
VTLLPAPPEDDDAAFAHLPSGQRLYGLLLSMTDEQVFNASISSYARATRGYPVLAELFSDVDELASSLLDEDGEDPVAVDFRRRWARLDQAFGDPAACHWRFTVDEGRERARVIKRFMLRAGPLSLRRRKGETSSEFWTEAALEYR